MSRKYNPIYDRSQVQNSIDCWKLMHPGSNLPFLLSNQEVFDCINAGIVYNWEEFIEEWPLLEGGLLKEKGYAPILSHMKELNDKKIEKMDKEIDNYIP